MSTPSRYRPWKSQTELFNDPERVKSRAGWQTGNPAAIAARYGTPGIQNPGTRADLDLLKKLQAQATADNAAKNVPLMPAQLKLIKEETGQQEQAEARQPAQNTQSRWQKARTAIGPSERYAARQEAREIGPNERGYNAARRFLRIDATAPMAKNDSTPEPTEFTGQPIGNSSTVARGFGATPQDTAEEITDSFGWSEPLTYATLRKRYGELNS